MAIEKTARSLETLNPGKARLAGAVASAVSLVATAGMAFWIIGLLGGSGSRADLAGQLMPALAFAAIGLIAGAILLLRRHVGAQQFLLGYWLAVTVAAMAMALAVILWKAPVELAEQLGLAAGSANKWIALAALAMVALGTIVVVLLTAVSEPHSRQRYASMVIVSISLAIAAVLAVNMLAEKKPVHKSWESLGRYGMSERTRRILKDVKAPLRLTCVYTSTDDAMQTAEKRPRVLELLDDMKLYSDKITVANVTNDGQKAKEKIWYKNLKIITSLPQEVPD